jgi:hypothetical protein
MLECNIFKTQTPALSNAPGNVKSFFEHYQMYGINIYAACSSVYALLPLVVLMTLQLSERVHYIQLSMQYQFSGKYQSLFSLFTWFLLVDFHH